jgi:hypothetical protein
LGQAKRISDSDNRVKWERGYEKEGRIAVRQSAPFPLTVAAIMPQLVVYDRG